MTQARYDTVLLTPDIIRNLVAVEHLTRNMTRMLTHIDAAFPAFVEAVQQSMRPGASQGNNGVRSSDVSDRTLAEVMRRSRGYDTLTEVNGLRAEIEGLTRQLEKLITSQRTQADEYDLLQVKKAIRCNGDPTCHSNALRNGLCGPCEAAGWGSAVTQRTGGLRPADGRVGPRLPSLAGIVDTGRTASLAKLTDTSGVVIDNPDGEAISDRVTRAQIERIEGAA